MLQQLYVLAILSKTGKGAADLNNKLAQVRKTEFFKNWQFCLFCAKLKTSRGRIMRAIVLIVMALILAGCTRGLSREQEAIPSYESFKQKWDAKTKQRSADFDAWRKRKAAAYAKECREKGEPAIGMTKSQLLETCWGKPRNTNTTTTAYGTSEQLVFGAGRYVYLRNGVVEAIHQ
jgi:hypothetical protein